ncbi:MAG: S-methyl-5'-thioadenosine phosphorylase [Actinobacteria bacterium]|nr:S-methyl-5'-thioadenosine phosphorylase [Actinomycetota bacterium]
MIGVIGGSGFYRFLDDVEEVELATPYGPTSAPLALGRLADAQVVFLPRHGRRHELPPHRIPYRANIWALREVGARRILGPNASGSLRPELRLGEFVICDQFVDRTTGRTDTFYEGPDTTHVSAADPYCPELRRILYETALELGIPARDRGTVVTIQGPRFSTRAESRWFQSLGWDVVNMTAYPEGHLARELELCYANVSMITDYDVGVENGEPVSQHEVARVFAENNERLLMLLRAVIPKIGPQPHDTCATALQHARF